MNPNNLLSCQQISDISNMPQKNTYFIQQYQTDYHTPQLINSYNDLQNKFLEYIRINRKLLDYYNTQNLILTLYNKYEELSTKPLYCLDDFRIKNYEPSYKIPSDMIDFAIEIGKETNTDIFSCIMAICISTSIAMRGRYRVFFHAYWSEQINIYGTIAKPSGEQKSAIVKYLRKPFNERQARKILNNRDQSNNSLKSYASQIKKVKKNEERLIIANYIKNINKDGEGPESTNLLLAELSDFNKKIDPYIPQEYSPEEIFCNVSTFLGLLKKLNQQGETIALLEAEASFIFSKYFKESVFTTLLNNAYCGEPFQYDTSTKKNKIELQTPSINILLFLQTEFMVEHFDNEDLKNIGYLPRVLPIFASDYVAPRCPIIMEREVTANPSQRYSEKINQILDVTFTQDRHREIFDITCEPEAYNLIKEFQSNNRQDVLDNSYPHMVPFIKKLHGHAIRIAGAIHGWNHLEPHKHPLTVEEMQIGISLALTVRDHANIAFNTELKKTKDNAIKILRYILRQDWTRSNHLIYVTQLQQNVGLKKSQCIPALDFLEKHNCIRQHHEPGHAVLCILHRDIFNVNLDALIAG